ncbi:hypothetical protein AB0M20_40275, partial [Actinoplanes sp. NPDC051633]
LGSAAASEVPMAALLSFTVGGAAPVVAAAAAVLLTLGAANAYLTGGAALARDLGTRRFVPAIVAASVVILALIGAGRLPVNAAITVSTSFFLLVYLACMVSAARVLRGPARVVAAFAAVAVLVVLAFGGWAMLPAAAVAALALLRPRRSSRTATSSSDREASPARS